MTGMCGKQAATKRVDYLPRVKEKKKKSLILILQANEIKSSQVWAG